MSRVVSKSLFAAEVGVTRARLSQWLRSGAIDGDAIVGVGHRARIRVDVARAQLKSRLDVTQRIANGTAKLDGPTPDPIDAAIRREKLAMLELGNEKARAEAAVRAGRYVEADEMRQELGRVAGRLVAAFEGALPELADAVAAESSISHRDVLHALRAAWRDVRARLSGVEAEAALAEPAFVEAAP